MAKKSKYSITIETGGETYKSKGGTLLDALNGFDLSWENIKIKGIMIIETAKKSLEHRFNVIQLRRIFNNKTTRLIQAKHLELLLKDKTAKPDSE